jgi:hypothetical protein
VLTIGVTGHRLLAEVDKLRAGINQALLRIDQCYPREDWMVLSSLAEGADRLVVDCILTSHPAAQLVVPLPFPFETYKVDFLLPGSIEEFQRLLALASKVVHIKQAPSREDAYHLAMNYILLKSDVLIAVWDGARTRGRGGTGEAVRAARQKQLPLAWVHAGNCLPYSQQAISLGAEQGQVTFERFD